MAEFSRTWWGQRFIAALEEFTERGRLTRGRGYARNGRVVKYEIADGVVSAIVRGTINPYFGVTEAPEYEITIRITQISLGEWADLIQRIASRADLVTKLLQRQMPDEIEEVFESVDLQLLPSDNDDFVTDCSCPDWQNPCKHIAGVCYRMALDLDQDPFLLFALRGLSREALEAELLKTSLGKILAASLETEEIPITAAESLHTRPTKVAAPAAINHREFWLGSHRLPPPEPLSPARVPALLVKKQGDYPRFWRKDISFIRVMEELYERVRTKSAEMK
jgi:uncharacterized Zn finger protein